MHYEKKVAKWWFSCGVNRWGFALGISINKFNLSIDFLCFWVNIEFQAFTEKKYSCPFTISTWLNALSVTTNLSWGYVTKTRVNASARKNDRITRSSV